MKVATAAAIPYSGIRAKESIREEALKAAMADTPREFTALWINSFPQG